MRLAYNEQNLSLVLTLQAVGLVFLRLVWCFSTRNDKKLYRPT